MNTIETGQPEKLTGALRVRLSLTRLAVVSILLGAIMEGGVADERDESRIRFKDITRDETAVARYARAPSANKVILDQIKARRIVDFSSLQVRANMPGKPRGAPGIAILDYDRDGDLDLYVTNGPGRANSLYSSQLKESGALRFIDVAQSANADLTSDDSTGVCFGDIDNDGDQDLVVLNMDGPNRLLENQGGDGFMEIGALSGMADAQHHPVSCAMGDINGDGYLDVVVANTYNNLSHRLPMMTFDYEHLMESNQLYVNQGNNRFIEQSKAAGIDHPARVTWAVALVDYDADGDVDLVTADDQGAKAPARYGGTDHGYVRLYRNDGRGHFTDDTVQAGTNRVGAWMGLAFGDINHDGLLDIYATNTGYYFPRFLGPLLGFREVLGEWASGWFLSGDGGQYQFPGVGALVDTPFGWGVSAVDYDNDSDTDIIYYGGIDMGAYVDASNNGTVLRNDGDGHYEYDSAALADSANHSRRTVQGVATGDLNNDGFMDVVTVASQRWPDPLPLAPYLPGSMWAGTPFDSDAVIWPVFVPVDPQDISSGFVYTGFEPEDGDLVIEINGGNENSWVKVETMGTVGITNGGRVNRNGIGAIVRFRPKGGETETRAVLGGSSYASQDSLKLVFGLGDETRGTLEVLWPGGHRNRLYDVHAGESVRFPEIPCDIRDPVLRPSEYRACVVRSLADLVRDGFIEKRQSRRFLVSAIRARDDYRRGQKRQHNNLVRRVSNWRHHDENEME